MKDWKNDTKLETKIDYRQLACFPTRVVNFVVFKLKHYQSLPFQLGLELLIHPRIYTSYYFCYCSYEIENKLVIPKDEFYMTEVKKKKKKTTGNYVQVLSAKFLVSIFHGQPLGLMIIPLYATVYTFFDRNGTFIFVYLLLTNVTSFHTSTKSLPFYIPETGKGTPLGRSLPERPFQGVPSSTVQSCGFVTDQYQSGFHLSVEK